MIKFKPTTGLIGILLASMLTISCGCGKGGSGKESKKEEETKKLVDEEKKLVDKEKKLVDEEKKLVAEEKKLVEAFKHKNNLTPEQVQDFEKKLNEEKNKNIAELAIKIAGLERIGDSLVNRLSALEEAEKESDPIVKKQCLEDFRYIFSFLKQNPVSFTVDEARTALFQVFEQDIYIYVPSFHPKDFNQIKQILSDCKVILENTKKQVELKEKG